VLVALEAVTPDAVEQVGAGEDLAGPRGEAGQQVELLRGEPHRAIADSNRALIEVQLHGAAAQPAAGRRLRLLLPVRPHPPQDGLRAGHQLAEAEGLGQVVVGAELEAEHAVDLGRSSREDQQGREVAAAAQGAADLPAVGPRQHQVEDEQVEVVGLQPVEGGATVALDLDLEAVLR